MSMWVCLRRVLFVGALLLFAGLALLYFKRIEIVEALLLPRLEASGAQLELESIDLSASAVRLQVKHYRLEDNLQVEGLSVVFPWNQLYSLEAGFIGRIQIDRLRYQLEEGAEPPAVAEQGAAGEEAFELAEQVAQWASSIDSLPVASLELKIEEWGIEAAGLQMQGGLELSVLRGMDGATHLAASLSSPVVDVDARVKVLAAGAGLSLDFTLRANDWDTFQASYLSELSSVWTEAAGEIYLNALQGADGFVDASGYARWLGSEPDQLSFCVLADLGAVEVYAPAGELILQNAAAGFAFDGRGHQRAYLKGGVERVRVGSWMESSGDWAVRLDNQKLAAELRLGESIAFSLAHDDWQRLLSGAGRARYYLEANALDAELLRALEVSGLPDDLSLQMALQVEGSGLLEHWELREASAAVDAKVASLELSSQGLTATDIWAQVDLRRAEGPFVPESLQLQVGSLALLGFELDALQLSTQVGPEGTIAVSPVRAGFLGGSLRVDPMQVDLQRLDDSKFRIQLNSVDLSQLAQVVPQFKGEISGRASGYLVGAFQQGQAILTDGRLEVDSAEGARLRYDVEGMLTRGMVAGSATYQQYRMAERAFEDLMLQQFSIDVFPDGNATRPFRLELFGESQQGDVIVPVDFDLNVNVDDTAGVMELLRMIQRGELEF
ncbi:MAG: hypothetical protein CML13_19065 [Puniceicoccaceae bacterium]|nr:hypothetical protein [Puniceicoccaceae bacterium]